MTGSAAKLRNCIRCGKVFVATDSRICDECLGEEARQFEKVRDYIRDNPDATMIEVADETDVPTERIKEWVRQGRLTFSQAEQEVSFACAFCGRPIKRGRICDECAAKWGGTGEKSGKAGGQEAKFLRKNTGRVHIIDRFNEE